MQDDFDRQLLDTLRPHAEHIVEHFYTTLLTDPGTRTFLDHEQVNRVLRDALREWLLDALATTTPESDAQFQERQRRVGEVHSRINVPLGLVNRGMAILKQQCCLHLQAGDSDRQQLWEMTLRLHRRLDSALNLINETYLRGAMETDRHTQSLRVHLIDNTLAVECERLRSGLFDWMRRNLLLLYRRESNPHQRPVMLGNSDLGLWVIHKAELLFPDMDLVQRLKDRIQHIDLILTTLADTDQAADSTGFQQTMETLDQAVSDTGWMLSTLAEHVLESERCRDPLTRVLSRRFMTGTLQREVRISQQTRVPFALLMIDVDHFKRINDVHGHEIGDLVLAGIAELLMGAARATDFVFRYGGEEFLMVFNGASATTAVEMAERIRERVASQDFPIPQQQALQVSVSIGVALFEDHPDYQQLLNQADQALLQAKRDGRNCCVLYQAVMG